MAFTAKKTDNSIAAVVNDYEATIVGGLLLLGYGYVNYAEEIANDFVRVAENFANATPPGSPLKGQLWWDTSAPSTPSLWVCFNPTASASPITNRWARVFQVNGSGTIDAYTLRTFAPSTTSVASTVVVRGTDGKIDAGSLPAGSSTLDSLSDVATSGSVNGSLLKFNGSSWGPGGLTLDNLSDVNTAGAVTGSVIKFDGTNWVVGVDISGGGGGSVAWGGITGSISSQTDLVSALAGKSPNAHNHVGSEITNLLTYLQTIDGPSSGLDADLLDGQHGVFYLDRANHTGTLAISDNSIVSQSDFSERGYVKIGSFYMQWGSYTVPSRTGSYQVFFPIAFPNNCLRVMISAQGDPDFDNDESDEDFWASPGGNTSFLISAQGDRNSVSYAWFALGY